MAEDVGQLVVKVAMENSSFQQGIQSLNKELKVVQSEFKVASAQLGEHGKKLDALKINADMLSKSIQTQSKIVEMYQGKLKESQNTLENNAKKQIELADAVNRAEKAYKDSEQTLGKNAEETKKLQQEYEKLLNQYSNGEEKIINNQKAIDNWTVKANNAKAKLSELQGELNKTTSEINKNNNGWLKASEKLESSSNTFKKFGEGASSAGNKILGLAVPLLGVGVAAAKVGMDFDSEMSRVKAISGSTGEEFQKLNDQAITLGANTAFSAKEAAEGMENLASAGFNTTEIMQAMPGMLDLAASSGEDLATSSDIAASTLRGFGLAASEAGHVADVLAKNASATNAAVGDTGEAMKYIAPVAHAMGLSLEEVTAAIGEMANSGIKGSQAGTTLRSALVSLASPSKEAATLMEEIGFTAFDTQGKLFPLNQVIANLQQSTKEMTDEQKQNVIATIFGQEAMSGMLTLVQAGPQQLNDLTSSLKNSSGAAKEMAKTMQDNAKSSVEQMWGSLETAGIKLEQSFAPTIKKVADTVGNLALKFSELSPGTQKAIVDAVGFTVVLGGTLKVVGGLANNIGGIVSLLGKFSGSVGTAKLAMAEVGTAATVAEGAAGAGGILGLGASLGTVAIAAAPWLLAGAAVAGTGYAIYKGMTQQAVPAVDLFGEHSKKAATNMGYLSAKAGVASDSIQKDNVKISDSTKSAITAYMNLDKKAGTALLSLKANNTKVTQQIAEDMSKNINDMAKQIVDSVKKRSDEGIETFQTFFKNAKNITDNEKNNILSSVQDGYNQQAKSAEDAKNKINEIYLTAANNNRQITDDEVKQIEALQEQMRQQAVTVLSQSQLEQQAIYEGIKNSAATITTQQASEVIKNSAAQRDQTIAAATDQAKKVEAEIIYQRDVAHTISKDQADKLIQEAERQKTESITKAQEQHTQVVNEVSKQCVDIKDTIDTKSGEIKSVWQTLCDWFTQNVLKPKVDTSEANFGYMGWKAGVPGGYASGTTNATKGWHMVGENGPELLWFDGGETVLNNQDTAALFEKLESKIGYASAKAWGSDLIQGIADGINSSRDKVHDAVLATADSIYRVLHFSVPDEGPLSNADTYGSDFMQLLADTMSQYSNEPAEVAQKAADLVAQKIKSVKDKLADEIKDLNNQLSGLSIRETSAAEGVTGASKYSIEEEYSAKKKVITDEIALREKQADKEIEQIQKIGKMSKEELTDELDAREKAAENIDKLNNVLEKVIDRKLNSEKEAATESAKLKAKEEKLTKDQLNNLLEYVNDYYEKKLDKDAIAAQAEQLITSKNQDAIIDILNKYGNLYEDSGLTLGQRLTTGVKSWTDLVPGIVGNAMQNVQAEVQTAAVNVQNTLSNIMQNIATVGVAGAEFAGIDTSNFDDIFSKWKDSYSETETEDDPVQDIEDKYKKTFSDIELSMTKLGKDTYSVTQELKKQQDTIDLQNEKLSEMKKEYKEIVNAVGATDDSAVQLKNDIESLSVEIENNTKKLQQDTITNNYEKILDGIDLEMIKLGKTTKGFNEELENQNETIKLQTQKLDAMKEEYADLIEIFGADSDAAKSLAKDIASLDIEIQNDIDNVKQSISDNIDSFTNKIKEALKARYEEQEKLEEDSINQQLSDLETWKTESEKTINSVYDARIKALDAEKEAEDRASTDATELANINQLKESIDYEHNEYNKEQLQKQLNTAVANRDKRLREQEISDQKAALEQEKQNQLDNLNTLYEANKNDLEKKLQDVQDFYAKKLDATKLEAQAEKIIMNNNQIEILALLENYSSDYENAGKTLGEKLYEGFAEKIKGITDMISSITSKINAVRDSAIQAASDAIITESYQETMPTYAGTSKQIESQTVINSEITYNSPVTLSPSEQNRQVNNMLTKVAFSIR